MTEISQAHAILFEHQNTLHEKSVMQKGIREVDMFTSYMRLKQHFLLWSGGGESTEPEIQG